MPQLRIQEAKSLFDKIHSNPKMYNLKIVDGILYGNDDKISFKLYKTERESIFEVIIDGVVFDNKTGDWNNAYIMLRNKMNKIEKEKENQKVSEAFEKLRKYISE